MSTVDLHVELPNQQLDVNASVLKSPLTVLDLTVQSAPPAAKPLQPAALADVWWAFRFRHDDHARLGYGSLPPVPVSGIAASTAPYVTDPNGAHDLSFEHRFDVKGNRLLGGMSIAWIDDGSLHTVPQLSIIPLEPAGTALDVPVTDIKGYMAAPAQVPLSIVLRWAFVSDSQLATLLDGRLQGVVLITSPDGRIVAAVRWDADRGTVVSMNVDATPEKPEGDLPDFSSLWWEGSSHMGSFPRKTHNNQQQILATPMPVDAQEIVCTAEFKRELFLDGPGWVLAGSPHMKSLLLDVLDERGTDAPGTPFPANVTADGQPLTEGQDFGTTTIVSYEDLQVDSPSNVALRLLWIPANVIANL